MIINKNSILLYKSKVIDCLIDGFSYLYNSPKTKNLTVLKTTPLVAGHLKIKSKEIIKKPNHIFQYDPAGFLLSRKQEYNFSRLFPVVRKYGFYDNPTSPFCYTSMKVNWLSIKKKHPPGRYKQSDYGINHL
jgi:hypothetical protein